MQVFEEAKRNQLVTEVDIQAQVALDDYQVRLSDIPNPTQSQDNVVIDRFGEFLSHWNESLDFDTWVKMSVEVTGKRILMLRGNSSISSLSNRSAFVNYSSDLTTEGQAISSGDYAPAEPAGAKEGAFDDVLVSSQTVNDQWFSETLVGSGVWIGQNFNSAEVIVRYGVYVHYPVVSMTAVRIPYTWRLDGSNDAAFSTYATLNTQTAYSLTSQQWAIFDLNIAGDYQYYRMFITAVGTGSDNYAFVTEIEMMSFYIDATEPTWSADGKEKNIIVALKSLGRAG